MLQTAVTFLVCLLQGWKGRDKTYRRGIAMKSRPRLICNQSLSSKVSTREELDQWSSSPRTIIHQNRIACKELVISSTTWLLNSQHRFPPRLLSHTPPHITSGLSHMTRTFHDLPTTLITIISFMVWVPSETILLHGPRSGDVYLEFL